MPTTTYVDAFSDRFSDFFGIAVVTPDITPPPPTDPPPPTGPPPVPAERSASLIWYDPTGTRSTLTGFMEGVEVLEGVHGLQMPAIRTNRAPVAGLPGTRLQNVQHDFRTIDIPVLFEATSAEQLRDLLATWRHRFDPTRGDGQLWYVTSTATRTLTCRYMEGLEADEDSAHFSPTRQTAVLVFAADDPYWYDFNTSSQSWALAGTVPKWFAPPTKSILPLSFASSAVNGTNSIFNDGEVEAWPKWTIDGPATAITVTNDLTDETFTWAHALAAGERLVIDTRPGVKTVLWNAAPAFSYLTSYQLFALAPGLNIVTVALAGAAAGSNVTVEWKPAYLGPPA